MDTKKRAVIHFALDLYIILLSGQRFMADKLNMQEGLLKLQATNEFREERDLELTYTMFVNKN